MVLWQKKGETARHTTHARPNRDGGLNGTAKSPRPRQVQDLVPRVHGQRLRQMDDIGRVGFIHPRRQMWVAEPAHRCGYHTPPWLLADHAATVLSRGGGVEAM